MWPVLNDIYLHVFHIPNTINFHALAIYESNTQVIGDVTYNYIIIHVEINRQTGHFRTALFNCNTSSVDSNDSALLLLLLSEMFRLKTD